MAENADISTTENDGFQEESNCVDEAHVVVSIASNDSLIDVTAFIVDCATKHLSVQEPFLSDMDHKNATKSDPFNLHDAMAASQLMDKKMDCCEVPASAIAPWLHSEEEGATPSTLDQENERMVFPRPIPTGIHDPMAPLPWEDLTIPCAALIGVEMLVRFQSLLSGSSVGESTFTCLYAHAAVLSDMKTRLLVNSSLSSLVESVHQMNLHDNGKESSPLGLSPITTTEKSASQWSVFACALALVELTESVREIILNVDIYEEEDFAVVTHNLPFFTSSDPNVSSSDPNVSNSGADHGDDGMDTVDILERVLQMVEDFPPSEYTATLQLVLRYQWNLLHIVSSMTRLHGGMDLQPTMGTIQKVVQLAVQQLMDIHVLVTKFTEDGVYDSKDMKLILQRSFDSYIIRPLVGNMPIRKISFHSPTKALSLLRTITSELDTCVCSILLKGTTLSRIQRMLDRTCYANIFCRSLLLLNLYFDERIFGRYDLRDLLLKDMHQLQRCSFINAKDNIATCIDQASCGNVVVETSLTFLNRLAKPIYDSLKVRILNRNRQRTFVELVLLPEWASLQHEAHVVDVKIQQRHAETSTSSSITQPTSPFFTRYVLTAQIRLMDRYVEAGIEQCLFRFIHCDISFAFWYRDYLLSALHLQLSSMHQSKESDVATILAPTVEARESKAKGASKKKYIPHKNAAHKNGKHNGGVDTQSPREAPSMTELEDAHELKVIALKRNLCRKTIQYMAALSQAGVLKEQQFEFTTLEHIFIKRFEVFHMIQQPPPLTYDHYLDGMNFSNVFAMDLIPAVSEGFQHCRTAIEQLLLDIVEQKLDPTYVSMNEADLRSLIKVCVGNAVYVQRLKQLVEKAIVTGDGPVKAKATFDFESHQHFCIIKVEAL